MASTNGTPRRSDPVPHTESRSPRRRYLSTQARLMLVASLAAVALLVGLIAVPGIAAAQKTIKLDIIGPAGPPITSPSVAPSFTAGNVFAVKVTNTTPGSSNPNSFTVTVPSTPTTPNPNDGKSGFQITNVVYVPSSCTTDSSCGAFGVGSTNPNLSARFSWTDTTLSATAIDPMKTNQFIILKVTVATPSIESCPSTGPYDWSATGWTGTNGTNSGQPFTVTAGDGRSTLLTKTCPAAPTITIAATTPTTYTAFGATMTFSATTTGNPPPTITWQSSTSSDFSSNVTDITSTCSTVATPSTCSFTTVASDDGKYYRATANNGVGGDVFSNSIQIAYAPPCGTRVNETGGGTTAGVVLVKNPVNTDPNTSCDPKPFSLVVGERSIQVLPLGTTCSLADNTCATYVVYSDAWAPETAATPVPATIVSPTGNPPSTTGEEPEVWCDGTYDAADAPSLTNPDGTYGTSMPNNHTWCRILQTSTPVTGGKMQVTEISLLIGDAGRIRS